MSKLSAEKNHTFTFHILAYLFNTAIKDSAQIIERSCVQWSVFA